MESFYGIFPVSRMAKLLGITRAAFYKRLNRNLEVKQQQMDELVSQIKYIWEDNEMVYGLPRIQDALQKLGVSAGQKRIRKAMNLANITGKVSKKWRIATTDSDHGLTRSRDLIKRNFSPGKLNEIWCSDVTFIRTINSWIYLAVILDMCSKKVVAWMLSAKNDTKLIMDTLDLAIRARDVRPDELIFTRIKEATIAHIKSGITFQT